MYGLQHRCGRPVIGPQCVHLTEWDHHCNRELDLLYGNDVCKFVDIAQFYTDEVKRYLKDFKQHPDKIWKGLLPSILDGSALWDNAPCRSHKPGRCCLKRSDRHIATFSCTDMSTMNNDRPKSLGKTMIYTLVWAGLRRKILEPVLAIENVKGFEELLKLLLGNLYHVNETDSWVHTCPPKSGRYSALQTG